MMVHAPGCPYDGTHYDEHDGPCVEVDGYPRPAPTFDAVDRPAYYAASGVEVIDALEAWLSPEEFDGFCKGNVLKYVARAGKKDPARELEDYRKARWYLDRLIGHQAVE